MLLVRNTIPLKMLVVLFYIFLWLAPISYCAIPSERYPAGWPKREYPMIVHRAIVDQTYRFVYDGMMIWMDGITSALDIMLLGSNGETADEIRDVISLKTKNKSKKSKPVTDKFHVRSYLGVYLPRNVKLNQKYAKTLRKKLKVDLELLTSRQQVDEFNNRLGKVHASLRGLIKGYDLPYLPDLATEMVVVTGAAFSIEWRNNDEFFRQNRRLREFNVDETRRTYVEVMYGLPKQRDVSVLGSLRAKMLLLPLKKSRVKFMVILPDLMEGLRQLEMELEHVDIRNLVKTEKGNHSVLWDVRLPLMNLKTNLELANNLVFLGITKAFNYETANFSKVTSGTSKRVFVDHIKHLTSLHVTEKGINVPQTGLGGINRHLSDRPISNFYATHPFFFALVDEDKVYFTGRYGQFEATPDDY